MPNSEVRRDLNGTALTSWIYLVRLPFSGAGGRFHKAFDGINFDDLYSSLHLSRTSY